MQATTPPAREPQRQDSLTDQLRDLHALAVRRGMYDAADWLMTRPGWPWNDDSGLDVRSTVETPGNATTGTLGAFPGTLENEPLGSRWSERLIFDRNVSDSSPVIKGTWVTVEHVVSLVVDGWTWSDILRCHPEICEDDIRTCLAYMVAEDADEVTT